MGMPHAARLATCLGTKRNHKINNSRKNRNSQRFVLKQNPQESSYFEFLWVLFLILTVFLKRQTIEKHDLKLGSAGI